ncbi:MAG: 50S ribosomal protein L24 [Pseudomonadota bacterium]
MEAAGKGAKLKIRKGDTVVVISGRDKGKTGSVLRVIPERARVVVQGVNIVKRHTRPSGAQQGGIVEKELPIHVSNLAHIDPKDRRPTRVGFKFVEGRKLRFARRSGEMIDR